MGPLALIAALCFLLRLLGVMLGTVDLVTLGLFFLALHFAIGGYVAARMRWGPRG
jgi:hypothetical protein